MPTQIVGKEQQTGCRGSDDLERDSSMRPSTFSLAAADPAAGEVGIAVQSKFLAVGAIVPWASASAGAIATQSFADVTFGPRGLKLLESGLAPQEVLDQLIEADRDRELRQVGIVDTSGLSASYTGKECFEHAKSITGPNYACQGNVLASPEVVSSMAEAFEQASGPLPERMIEALRAGQRAGGDRRGMESANLLIVKANAGYGGNHDRYIDLRVDHHDDPIEQLAHLLSLHRFYFQRPSETDILEVDSDLEDEIGQYLDRLGKLEAGEDVWDALNDYVGWNNLEERWLGKGRIDVHVLEYLRSQAS